MNITELKKAIAEKKVTVLDVNGSESYSKGHIPTAIDFRAKKDEIASVLPSDKGALVVAYCGGPTCGAYAAAAKKATETKASGDAPKPKQDKKPRKTGGSHGKDES